MTTRPKASSKKTNKASSSMLDKYLKATNKLAGKINQVTGYTPSYTQKRKKKRS